MSLSHIEKQNLQEAYNILINTFERSIREYILTYILSGEMDWKKLIPEGIHSILNNRKKIQIEDLDRRGFLKEINFDHAKQILVFKGNYQFARGFVGELEQGKFIRYMELLVLCQEEYVGYSCFNFILASSFLNCQFIDFPQLLRW